MDGEQTWPENPFWTSEITHPNQIDERFFFNRGNILGQLKRSVVNRGEPGAVLHGPRRAGKTSVLQKLWQELDDLPESERPVTIFIDVRPFRHPMTERLQTELFWGSFETKFANALGLKPAENRVRTPLQLTERMREYPKSAGGRRLVCIVDETELLYTYDPRFLAGLLAAFEEANREREGDLPYMLILGWGRWYSSDVNPHVASALKGYRFARVTNLDDTALKSGLSKFFGYCGLTVDNDAEDLLWRLTKGHPYYAMALGRELYEARRAAKDPSPIQASDLTPELVMEAAYSITGGLTHAWKQVGRTQRLFCWALAQCAVRSAGEVEHVDAAHLEKYVPFETVLEVALKRDPNPDRNEMFAAPDTLRENEVLDRNEHFSGPYRFTSPFLAYWFMHPKMFNLDEQKHELMTGRSVTELVEQALAEEEGKNLPEAVTFLRSAHAVDATDPRVLFNLGRLLDETREHSEAITLLKQAHILERTDSRIRKALALAIGHQIKAMIEDDEDPGPFWLVFREVFKGTTQTLQPEVAGELIAWYARRWRCFIEEGQYRRAEETLRTLERMGDGDEPVLPKWRSRVLQEYTALLQTHPLSRERMMHCLAAIPCGFLILTEREVAFEFGVDPHSEPVSVGKRSVLIADLPEHMRLLIERAAGTGVERLDELEGPILEAVKGLLDALSPSGRDQEPFWEVWRWTFEVLRTASDAEPAEVPDRVGADVFAHLLNRVPKGYRQEIEDLLIKALPRITAADIIAYRRRGLDLIDMLEDLTSKHRASSALDLTPIREALDTSVLLLLDEATPHEKIAASYGSLYGYFSLLLKRKDPDDCPWIDPRAALDLIDFIVKAARPGDSKDEQTVANWLLVAEYPETTQAWKDLIDLVMRSAPKEDAVLVKDARELLDHLTPPSALAPLIRQRNAPPSDDAAELKWAQDLLDQSQSVFRLTHPLEDHEALASHGFVKRFMGRYRIRKDREDWENVHIKIYRIEGQNEPVIRFLESLWAQERRILFEIAGTRHARAMARLKMSDYRADKGFLILVTEDVGPSTLREYMNRRREESVFRESATIQWREIHSILLAMKTLHDARILHRYFRPETIRVQEFTERSARARSDAAAKDCRLKLADFEWSIYLHALFSGPQYRRRVPDYYLAPEVILSELNTKGPENLRGESFASDIYSLGLVLFELLIRDLKSTEVQEFWAPSAYALAEHEKWLSDICQEIRNSNLTINAKLMLLSFLKFDPRKRETDLTVAIRLSRQLAIGAGNLQSRLQTEALPAIAALDPVFDDPACIARWIEQQMNHQIQFRTKDDVKAFIQKELQGAKVYENTGSPMRPLYLEGKNVNFTAEPFVYHSTVTREKAFLRVASRLDSPGPEPVVILKAGVDVANLLPGDTRIGQFGHGSTLLEDLFDLVAETGDLPAATDKAAAETDKPTSAAEQYDDASLIEDQSTFYQALQLISGAEDELIEEFVLPYSIVQGPERIGSGPYPYEQLVIAPRQDPKHPVALRWQTALRTMVTKESQLNSPLFELASRQSTTEWLSECRQWRVDDVDSESTDVTLVRRMQITNEKPPNEGWLRPVGIIGYQALSIRRHNLLQRLKDDVHVMQAITNPDRAYHEVPVKPHAFILKLDDDKQRIVEKVLRSRPMVLVQGPPGTGKTTLAAEVILQMLEESPTNRILVTAQGHAPLNNLLEAVDKAINNDGRKTDRRTSVQGKDMIQVRMVPERRLTVSQDDDDPGRYVESQFHPSVVAERLLNEALSWSPSLEKTIDPGILDDWRNLVRRQRSLGISDNFQRRLIESASIVFATANDRTMQSFTFERPFDLLIFEEAARALPLELFAPMVNAPRWLLIGDPEQLPPYSVQDIERKLDEKLTSEDANHVEPTEKKPLVKAVQILELFNYLYSKDAANRAISKEGETREDRQPFTDQLTRQYRMHPAIRVCVSETYYKGKLLDGNEAELLEEKRHRIIKPVDFRGCSIVWVDIPRVGQGVEDFWGEEASARGGYTNHAEIHAIQRLLASENWQMRGPGGFRVGEFAFLSPYRAQVERFKRVFDGWQGTHTGPLRDKAYTVDSFQGRQADVVIVSLVRNNRRGIPLAAMGFLRSPERSVVMFSRAQKLLIVVGCSELFCRYFTEESPIRKFYENIMELTGKGKPALIIDAPPLFNDKSYQNLRSHWSQREEGRQSRSRRL